MAVRPNMTTGGTSPYSSTINNLDSIELPAAQNVFLLPWVDSTGAAQQNTTSFVTMFFDATQQKYESTWKVVITFLWQMWWVITKYGRVMTPLTGSSSGGTDDISAGSNNQSMFLELSITEALSGAPVSGSGDLIYNVGYVVYLYGTSAYPGRPQFINFQNQRFYPEGSNSVGVRMVLKPGFTSTFKYYIAGNDAPPTLTDSGGHSFNPQGTNWPASF